MPRAQAIEIPEERTHVVCRDCAAIMIVDGFNRSANPTARETAAFVNQVADAKGWGYGTDFIDGQSTAYWLCPTHLRHGEEASTRILPRFDNNAKCSACGHDNVGTIHCHGRTSTCELGAPRNHLHRTCERCGWKWIEGRLDDPKTE